MARGLLASQGTTAASSLLCTVISRVSISSSKWIRTTICLAPKPPLRTPHNPRLFCTCSTHLHPRPVPISNFRDAFSNRMAMAGIKPHHRLAIGVSGGPDSMALCVLAAGWKLDACVGVASGKGGFIEGLLAIIVDHGLRKESKDEADLVSRRVSEMGIRCEVVRCDWSDGKPKQGHLQEAARNMRYQILQNVCIKHQSAVLLTAHHADDQAELFIIRLSRNSGVLGLAGMAFTSHLFSYGEAPDGHRIMLVRPLLDFSKEDMYEICKAASQEWVEDPSNQSLLFARNRIRMSLGNLSSSSISELRALISACRRTRSYVERICCNLINQAVTVMPEGYAVIDLKVLNPSKIEDICLSKFLTLVLQFVSQRHRPLRGGASKLLLNYFRSFPCKTSLTAAGCYLCAAPGSKGTSVLVCCSTNSPPPSKMEILSYHPCEGRNHRISIELEQIIDGGNLYSANSVLDGLNVNFLNATSCESVLTEARRLNIISESTCKSIHLLQSVETKHFKSSAEIMSSHEVKSDVVYDSTFVCQPLLPGKIGYFMNRFVVTWKLCLKTNCCRSCVAGHDVIAELRHMVDADWLHLTMLAKCQNFEQVQQQMGLAIEEDDTERADLWSQSVTSSAQKALVSLKPIPAAARRALPVLVNSQGLLLSIPSICFSHCPCLEVSATFKPRVPLGGGYNSFT